MIKILVFCDRYLPGSKWGGPIRSISNLVEHLGDQFKFRIISRDRDYGDNKPYQNIIINEWNKCGKAEVRYLSPNQINPLVFLKIIKSTPYNLIYLNSFFSPGFTILPLLLRRMNLFRQTPFIIAPRGELSDGALKIKVWKKRFYAEFSHFIGLYRSINWHVSNQYEKEALRKNIQKTVNMAKKKDQKIFIASDLPISSVTHARSQRIHFKLPGSLKIIFLSRICQIKNLIGAIECLSEIKGNIEFDIFGPIEDMEYWAECQKKIKTLPPHIKVAYRGIVNADKVILTLSKYDLFFLPTFGENYGHAIVEAWMAGCPVLISNLTPWQKLEEKGVGWEVSLENKKTMIAVLQTCVNMDEKTFQHYSQRAFSFALEQDERKADVLRQYRKLFLSVIEK